MTPELIAAATDLTDLLTRENAALGTLDFAHAGSLAEAKRAAADRFVAAQAQAAKLDRRAAAAPQVAAVRSLVEHLSRLATENKRLLERAMVVQGRVIATMARAIPKAVAGPLAYRSNGAFAATPKAPPVAFSARA